MGNRSSSDEHKAMRPDETRVPASGEVLSADAKPKRAKPKCAKPSNSAAASLRRDLAHALHAPAPRLQVKPTKRLEQSRLPLIADERVQLKLGTRHKALLHHRAHDARLTLGHYVCALLDDTVPAPIPVHHAQSVLDLRASTDHLAALSTDLNAFSRLLGSSGFAQLAPVRASVDALLADVRVHLALAATLIAELKPHWRGLR